MEINFCNTMLFIRVSYQIFGELTMFENLLERVALSKINNALKKLDNDNCNEALKILEEAKTLCAKFDPKQEKPTFAGVLIGIGAVYQKQGKDELAINNYQLALSIRNKYYNDEPRPENANLLNMMGDLCEKSKKFACPEDSYSYYIKAYTIRERLYEPSNAELLNNRLKLGTLLLEKNQYEECIPHFENYLKYTKQIDENKGTIANIEYALGICYYKKEKPELNKSVEHFRESLAKWQLLKEPQHIIDIANIMAKIYADLGKTIDAADTFLISLDEQLLLLANVSSANFVDEQKASLLVKKGNAYQAKGMYYKSIEFYQDALKLYPDKSHQNALDTLSKIAEEYTKLGEVETSECYNGLIEELVKGNDVKVMGVCEARAAEACKSCDMELLC